MAAVSHLPDDVPWREVFIFLISILLSFAVWNYVCLNDSDEQPVSFHIPIPEQCNPTWRGDVLEQPSIKVAA